ncbi:MAG: hypothetical protein U0441_08770 [Polyangiaceae bacterium]
MISTTSPLIRQFWTPAHQQDFKDDPTKQSALDALWTSNLDGFTQQGILGNPWNATSSTNNTAYFNPLTYVAPYTPTVNSYVAIQWNAFPGRIGAYFPSLSAAQAQELADTGYYRTDTGETVTFGTIPASPCAPVPTDAVPYGPYGPRGWQDEYCEWSVTRNDKGQITRVDITCENPEYWNSLWRIDPQRVCDLYRSTLGKTQIELADLYLVDRVGAPVIDPSTGLPAYNPLNKWNAGPISTASAGGAMHLTSTPNTLQTEIGLATAATAQRNPPPNGWTASTLICCAQYGQMNRNSDPNIGFSVNSTVKQGLTVTLANPPGLYIQAPDFSQYTTPDGTDASEYWTVTRGVDSLQDEWGNAMPGNFILHAVFEVPAGKGYTVSDISINGAKIDWASQIIQTINMHIIAMGFPATPPALVSCVGTPNPVLAQPEQLFHYAPFNAYYGTGVSTVNFEMSLLSNTTFVPPVVAAGSTSVPMVLTCGTVTLGPNGELPTVMFTLPDGTTDPNIKAVASTSFPVTYAVPGNSYPSGSTALSLAVTVGAGATPGPRGVTVTNYHQPDAAAMPSILTIAAAGSSPGPKGTTHPTAMLTGTNTGTTTTLAAFSPPADQDDFLATEKQQRLECLARWNTYIEACTQIAITGDPWQALDDQNRSFYFDQTKTPVPSGTSAVAIEWNAFPGRLNEYYGTSDTGNPNPFQLDDMSLAELADTGKVASNPAFASGFPRIPSEVCPAVDWKQDPSQWRSFGPPGPRGWLDEYCEIAVNRNTAGKITRVMFTCENPEYWFTLWNADPAAVLRIYRAQVSPDVQLEDLYLRDAKGNPVMDPVSGNYAYDLLNKWNKGTSVGAMHLTSPPNTVGAEIYLGAAATILRPDASEANPQSLICCSQYGQPFRNSDPHIGFAANQIIYNNAQSMQITLANPIGLYIQSPDFSTYTLPTNAPAGAKPSDYWTVTRGRLAAQAGTAYDQILHAVYEVPAEQGFTVSDIQIGGSNIQWGSQILRTFNIGLAALAIPTTQTRTQQDCPSDTPPSQTNLWPQLLMNDAVLNAYLGSMGVPPMPPPALRQGQSYDEITLLCAGEAATANIVFPDGGISAKITRVYAVPSQGMTAFVLSLSVAPTAKLGLQHVLVTIPGVTAGPPAPGIVNIVSGTWATSRLAGRRSRGRGA